MEARGQGKVGGRICVGLLLLLANVRPGTGPWRKWCGEIGRVADRCGVGSERWGGYDRVRAPGARVVSAKRFIFPTGKSQDHVQVPWNWQVTSMGTKIVGLAFVVVGTDDHTATPPVRSEIGELGSSVGLPDEFDGQVPRRWVLDVLAHGETFDPSLRPGQMVRLSWPQLLVHGEFDVPKVQGAELDKVLHEPLAPS